MITQRYVRKPFFVEAVQVTEENLEQVAEWVPGAHIRTQRVNDVDKRYVKLKITKPQNDRQTKAFPGDWVLFSDESGEYKVYTKNAFTRAFEPVIRSLSSAENHLDIAEQLLDQMELKLDAMDAKLDKVEAEIGLQD